MIVVGELKYLQYIENKICTIIVLAFFEFICYNHNGE